MVRAGGFQDVVEGYHLSVLLFLSPVSDCDMREVDDLDSTYATSNNGLLSLTELAELKLRISTIMEKITHCLPSHPQ